ncbi:MAG TPA: DUF5060 domain-containing protein, partial [Armatimonadota bacterium]|nr:DUF5060 domain-containing protein [Armatimonadota bacterium]
MPRQARHAIFITLLTAAVACIGPTIAQSSDLGPRTSRMYEWVEWSVANPTCGGNPFDLVATVTFTHQRSGKLHVTEMFYVGDETWAFRFTGTATGRWTFTTQSQDPDLDGHAGIVRVRPNADPAIRGFLTHQGNKYAVQTGNDAHLEGYLLNVYMNQQDYSQQHEHATRILGDPDRAGLIDAYWDDTRENGFNTYFFSVFYSWFRMGALSIGDFSGGADPDLDEPDPALFDALELAIRHAHQRGGRTHIWAWGDNGRKQTPNHLGDGFRGPRHQRLIRYIAARLGPLPGWTMNFGFDTIEMPSAEADGAWWAEQLNQRMGWPHLLMSRGWDDDSFGALSYAGFGGNPYELETTDKGPADYDEVRQHLQTRPYKPSIYEERHTYNRWRCWPGSVPDPERLNESGSRRLVWWEAMAGGMGGFFGHYSTRFNDYGPFRPEGPCGYHPESLKQAFRTHREFWRGRFLLDMEPRDDLTSAYCLASPDREHYVFYGEQTQSIDIDLSESAGPLPAVAIDTTADCGEIALGDLPAAKQTWTAPHESDWVIAVGDFS